MEMLNRAIEDASEFAAFMRKAEGTEPKPSPFIEDEPRPGNREQRRAASKAERRAKKAAA